MLHALNSGGDVVKELADKITKLDKERGDLAKQVENTESRIRAEEDRRRSSEQSGGKVGDNSRHIECIMLLI